MVPCTQLVRKNGSTTVRPLFPPNQSGIQPTCARSNVPGLLFVDGVPTCVKNVAPDSGCPTRLMPYSIAWRILRLAIAWFEFGLWRLNAVYGTVLIHGQMKNFGSWVDMSCWYELGLMVVSSGMSNLPACMSASCVAASLTPIV